MSGIKSDVNRSGHDSTDFPSVCEHCFGANGFLQVIKQDMGQECRLCTRPFTVFSWKTDRTARQKRTAICLTCSRLKNCCQCCQLDLSFGLPIAVRDAALKMIAPGPNSEVNREYYAQNNERLIEQGIGAVEEYSKTDDKARELLRRLANSEPYYKKQRRMDMEAEEKGTSGQRALPAPEGSEPRQSGYGPARPRASKYGVAAGLRGGARGGRGGGRGGRPGVTAVPIRPEDIAPPSDPNITSLFVTGVEDDLPEHEIRTHFVQFGTIRSLVCSHRSHCAFINYATRKGAEEAAAACQGKAIVKGVPLRVQWGRPKPLDTLDREQRLEYARAGRATAQASRGATAGASGRKALAAADEDLDSLGAIAPPPGGDDEVQYASLAGN